MGARSALLIAAASSKHDAAPHSNARFRRSFFSTALLLAGYAQAHRCTARLGGCATTAPVISSAAAARSNARSVWLILARNPEDLAPF